MRPQCCISRPYQYTRILAACDILRLAEFGEGGPRLRSLGLVWLALPLAAAVEGRRLHTSYPDISALGQIDVKGENSNIRAEPRIVVDDMTSCAALGTAHQRGGEPASDGHGDW